MDRPKNAAWRLALSLGLTIAHNLLANAVQFSLDRTQQSLKATVAHLSSGLRIESAADDPSGLAIATGLQTQVDGFTQSVQNVQSANNAAVVAEGALQTTTEILQRIRNLAVEAASDINSSNDRANLQLEVSQLLLEINRITQNTNFNGQALLDGSHGGFQAQQAAFTTITANAVLAAGAAAPLAPLNNFNPNTVVLGTSGTSSDITRGGFNPGQTVLLSFTTKTKNFSTIQYTDVNNAANDSALLTLPGIHAHTVSLTADAAGSVDFNFTSGGQATVITGFSAVPAPSPLPTTNVVPGFLIASVSAANANFFTTVGARGYSSTGTYATVDGTIEIQVINTGVSIAATETFIDSATGAVSVSSTLYGAYNVASNFENVSIIIGDIQSLDVGVSGFIKISQNVAALTNPNNPALNIHSAAAEGDAIQVAIGATNTQTLRVSNINLALSSANNPSLGAEDAIGQVDNALTRLLYQRAQLGAVIIRLNEDANNDNVAAVNLKASESSIRDLNVGQATTQFTRDQILVQVGTSVLAQSHTNAFTVLGLFRG